MIAPGTRAPGRPAGARAEKTRADLVRSARELFSRYGYHGTTFENVARQAGLTRPLVHYYFPTKQALYQQVTEDCYRTVVAPAVEEAAKETTLAQQVSVFIDVGGRAIAQDRSAAAFLCSAAAECATRPSLLDPQRDPIITVREFLTSAVRAAEQRGELRADIEVEPLVELLVAMLCGVWAYVGFLGAEHGRAITSMTYQLLTGRLSLISQPSDGQTKQ
jgi:AcrR family transcriptional regulator